MGNSGVLADTSVIIDFLRKEDKKIFIAEN